LRELLHADQQAASALIFTRVNLDEIRELPPSAQIEVADAEVRMRADLE
jgi:hypothetical protein